MLFDREILSSKPVADYEVNTVLYPRVILVTVHFETMISRPKTQQRRNTRMKLSQLLSKPNGTLLRDLRMISSYLYWVKPLLTTYNRVLVAMY